MAGSVGNDAAVRRCEQTTFHQNRGYKAKEILG